ncbi:MAG TPA: hypothetical protein VE395_08225, partial [Acidimicrobiales bacterium]|nr:hypothetical protein [Acidimicrobiales bacterium]
ILSGLVLSSVYTEQDNAFVPAAVAALAVLLYTVLHPEARRSRRRSGPRAAAASAEAAGGEQADGAAPAALSGATRAGSGPRE